MACPAVLIVAFNRPETTRRVFAAVREARPARLFFACDAPRPDRPGEAERVAEVRAILRGVDWPCEVRTKFPEANLGCGPANDVPSSVINELPIDAGPVALGIVFNVITVSEPCDAYVVEIAIPLTEPPVEPETNIQ